MTLIETMLRPVSAAWLAAYRLMFGLALSISMLRFLHYGWVDELLLSPRYRFHYWGFAWVRPLPAEQMHLLFWALAALGVAMAAGLAYRVSSLLFAVGLSYVQLIDVSTYLNHYYLAALLAWLLALSPAGRCYSVDAWLAAKMGHESRESSVAFAWLAVFRVQIAIVYLGAAVAKAQSDWLLHGQPLGIWLGARTDIPVLGAMFTWPYAPLLLSWCGFLFDATIVAWLSCKRTRPYAYLVVVIFHVLTRALFDIGMFPIIMSISALMFFEPDWPLRAKAWLLRQAFVAKPQAPSLPASHLQRLGLTLGAIYCTLQCLLPLRTFAYGGNVLWHEQGMRYSWRVMVRAKGGATTFFVKSRATGKVWQVSPSKYLAAHQENEMAGQPDLILQLAHAIGDDFARRAGPVEVRAESMVSLNARPGALLIDPQVDLLTIEDGLAPATWILPAPAGPPPPTRPVL